MGFWGFMFIMDLFIPITMIVFGKLSLNYTPKEINRLIGYRTKMSMKNKDTWVFAHKYCGKLWYVCGLILLPVSAVAMLFVIGKNENIVGITGGIVCAIQIILMIVAIILTEIALKRNFDKYGNKR